jgi:hypothetical protein
MLASLRPVLAVRGRSESLKPIEKNRVGTLRSGGVFHARGVDAYSSTVIHFADGVACFLRAECLGETMKIRRIIALSAVLLRSGRDSDYLGY